MFSRRDVLQVALAAAAMTGLPRGARAQSRAVRQEDLLQFRAKGQVTLLHMADTHAQLKPIYYREPSINLGVGDANGLPPHLTGRELLERFGIEGGSRDAYALSSEDFEPLARAYGRVGGMDRIAALVKAIRGERGADRTLLIDGGDALQGSYTALQSRGGDMVRVMEALGVDVTTGHWEFTLGAKRVSELFGDLKARGKAGTEFLAGNVLETDFREPVFRAWRMYEKGGVRIAVIGQAFPYTSVANPRWMVPMWSFGIREETVRRHVTAARAAGADLVVLNSHNGFDVDRKLASRVAGIDVILTAHTHDALPAPVKVGRTLLIASGSHGKFLSRLDVEVKDREITDYEYALIPVLSDAIAPDAEMAALVQEIRAPHEAMLTTELARTDHMLYRRGNFSGTLDDVICTALMEESDAELSLSPGFRWGASLLAGQAITWDDIYNATAMTYPNVYRIAMRGEAIKAVLEDVADNLFNPDPYYQQGGDMVRVGGLAYAIAPKAPMGQRISAMSLRGKPIEAQKRYKVAGWAPVSEEAKAAGGEPIWDVIGRYLKAKKTIAPLTLNLP
ncbi:MAG TPA: thiosulfohydrolase SoxB, partial [Hyphomicrobiaceae bacterium]